MDNAALLEALHRRCLGRAALDVWEGEPSPDPALIHAVALGTPHIAGYSTNGKLHGTQMLYEAVCAFLQRPIEWKPPQAVLEARPLIIDSACSLTTTLERAVRHSYDIRRDDELFRPLATLPHDERAKAFDRLRRAYPPRFEFCSTLVKVPPGETKITAVLRNLGFVVTVSS